MPNQDIHLIALSGKMGSGKDTTADIIQFLLCNIHNGRQGKSFSNKEIADGCQDADILRSLHGSPSNKWQPKRFATKLKQIASILTGIPEIKFEDQAFKETLLGPEWDFWAHGPLHRSNIYASLEEMPKPWHDKAVRHQRTVRSLLQDLGTNALRDVIHPNVHLNAMFSDWAVKTLTQDRENSECGLDVMTQVPAQHWLVTDMRFPNELAAVEARGGLTIRITRPGHDSGNIHPSETALDGADFRYYIRNNGSLEKLVGRVREILTAEGLL